MFNNFVCTKCLFLERVAFFLFNNHFIVINLQNSVINYYYLLLNNIFVNQVIIFKIFDLYLNIL